MAEAPGPDGAWGETEQAVRCLKSALDAALSAGSPSSKVVDTLQALRRLGHLSPRVIKGSGVGIAVNKLGKTSVDDDVRHAARELVEEWRQGLRQQIAEIKGTDASAPAAPSAAANSAPSSAVAAAPLAGAAPAATALAAVVADAPLAAAAEVVEVVEDNTEVEPVVASKVSVRTEYVCGERRFTALLECPGATRRFMAPQRMTAERAEADARLLRLIGERSPGSDDVAARWRRGEVNDREVAQALKGLAVQRVDARVAAEAAADAAEPSILKRPASAPLPQPAAKRAAAGEAAGRGADEDEGGAVMRRPAGVGVMKRPAGRVMKKPSAAARS